MGRIWTPPVVTGAVAAVEKTIWPLNTAVGNGQGVDFQYFKNVTLTVLNAGGGSASAFTTCDFMHEPDNEDAHDDSMGSLGTLAANAVGYVTTGDAGVRYMKGTATTGGDTTVEAYLTAELRHDASISGGTSVNLLAQETIGVGSSSTKAYNTSNYSCFSGYIYLPSSGASATATLTIQTSEVDEPNDTNRWFEVFSIGVIPAALIATRIPVFLSGLLNYTRLNYTIGTASVDVQIVGQAI